MHTLCMYMCTHTHTHWPMKSTLGKVLHTHARGARWRMKSTLGKVLLTQACARWRMKSTLGKVLLTHTVHVHTHTHTHTYACTHTKPLCTQIHTLAHKCTQTHTQNLCHSPLLRPLTHMKISIIASRKAKAFFSHMQLRVECMVWHGSFSRKVAQ